MNGIIGLSMTLTGALRLLKLHDRSNTQALCVDVAKETKITAFCGFVVTDCSLEKYLQARSKVGQLEKSWHSKILCILESALS
jgi:hypothetical protein